MSLIEINDASYTYPNGFTAVENINLKIEQADNIAIIGQNGAGKTTMVKLLNGLLKPSQGSVIVNGKNTKNRERYFWSGFGAGSNTIIRQRIKDEVCSSNGNERRRKKYSDENVRGYGILLCR